MATIMLYTWKAALSVCRDAPVHRSTLSTQLRLSMFKGDAILGGNRELFLAQNCLKRIMSPLLDFGHQKKLTKKLTKKSKNYFLSEAIINMSQLLDYTGKIDKNR